MIAQNPEMLYNLLGVEAEGDDDLPPGAQVISVSPEERAAIERVRASFVKACTIVNTDLF